MDFSDDEIKAMQQAMSSEQTGVDNNTQQQNNTPPPVGDNTGNNSSLNSNGDISNPPLSDDKNQVQNSTAGTNNQVTGAENNEPPKQKSFEEYLEERTAGKFKNWADVESIINTPKEEFASEDVKRWNELVKNGVTLDKEFFELQSLDLDQEEINPEWLMLEAMKRKPETEGLSNRALYKLLNDKYNYDAWISKDDDELTDDDLVNREIMARDAYNDLEWLKNYKKERTFFVEPNTEKLRADAEAQKQSLKQFEDYLDKEVFEKALGLTTEIEIDKDTKTTYEYKLSEAVRKETVNLMKLLPVDGNAMFNRYAEKDGNGNIQMNHRKVFEMLVKDRVFDEAIKNAYKDGVAYGAKNFVDKGLKNANFTPADNRQGTPVAQTEAEAIALAIRASGKKLN